MVFANRDASWGAQTRGSTYKDGEKVGKNGTAERSNHLAQANHSALRWPLNGRNAGEISTTVEIDLAGAHGFIVVAVTTDPELRSALTAVLPRKSIVFAASPEEVLARPIPNNCAVLIVEQSLSRAEFEQLKSHLKASAPALVNIMVGTRDDGSTLVGLLSNGWIDRFMVKPLEPGPTRIALRSALQQHNSLRSLVKMDSEKSEVPATGSVPGSVRDVRVIMPRIADDQVKRSNKPEIVAVALEKSEVDLEIASHVVIAPHREPAIRAATTPRQLSPPSWSALAAMVAVVALIAVLVAWGMSTRLPDVDVNKAMVSKIVTDHLAAAQRAFELGSYVDPPGLSATHFYNAALELDPTSVQAKKGLEAVADRLIADSKQLISTGELLRAQSALDNIRRMQPNHRELAEVTASLLSARETERITIQAAHAVANPTIEPIVVAAPHVAATSTAGKPATNPATNFDRNVANSAERQARLWQAEPRITGRVDSSSASKLLLASPIASAVDPSRVSPNTALQSEVNKELSNSSMKRADDGKIVTAQDAVASDAAAIVAVVRETTNPATGTSSTGSNSTGPVLLESGVGAMAASGSVGKPTMIKYVSPVYPVSGRLERGAGWLDVQFLVTSDGRVINPRIGKGTLGSKFHHAALVAATQWKFSPATNGPRPDFPMQLRLEFRLTD
jgi:TonB family protein